MNNIDAVYYINLEERKDRKESILKNMEILNLGEKLIRFEAIKNVKYGFLGCAQSHCEVIRDSIQKRYKNIMVVEDDFVWTKDKDSIYNTLENFFRSVEKWDVLLLGASKYDFKSSKTKIEGINKVLSAKTTTGYIVNSDYKNKLLENFEESVQLLKKEIETEIIKDNKTKNAIDVNWKKLQIKDLWYIPSPTLAKQMNDFSDIQKKRVNYVFM